MQTTTTSLIWKTAFPTFPDDEMPAIPSYWIDTSWRNDVCPSFRIAGDEYSAYEVICWVDSITDGELQPDKRFILERCGLLGRSAGATTVYEGDNWDALLKAAEIERLASAFFTRLLTEMSLQDWRDMRAANNSVQPGICASHNYRDANIDMYEAFQNTFGRDPLAQGSMSDEDASLWSAAWTVATPFYLAAPEGSPDQRFDDWRLTRSPQDSSSPEHDVWQYETGIIKRQGSNFILPHEIGSPTYSDYNAAERFLWTFYINEEN